MRAITNNIISERDRLLQYTIGEFYQEMSLFIEECNIKQKELDKIKNSI